MRGLAVPARHGVDVNILCTVHAANADHPLEVYRFFRDELRRASSSSSSRSSSAYAARLLPLANEGWGERGGGRPLYTQRAIWSPSARSGRSSAAASSSAIFDEWVRRDVGKVFVQMFDAALASLGRAHQPRCASSPRRAATRWRSSTTATSTRATTSSSPGYLLGNIQRDAHAASWSRREQQREVRRRTSATRCREYCRECDGALRLPRRVPEEPLHRDAGRRAGAELPVRGLQGVLHHIDEPMHFMAGLLRQGRYADEVMAMLASGGMNA